MEREEFSDSLKADGWWRSLVEVLALLSGFALVTLGLSYLLRVSGLFG